MDRHELDIIYVTSFYDIPLEGLCRYQGKIQKFKTDYDTQQSTIIFLSPLERIKALWSKWLFEICVGTHHTYKNGKRDHYFYWRKPKFLHALLYRWYFSIK